MKKSITASMLIALNAMMLTAPALAVEMGVIGKVTFDCSTTEQEDII